MTQPILANSSELEKPITFEQIIENLNTHFPFDDDEHEHNVAYFDNGSGEYTEQYNIEETFSKHAFKPLRNFNPIRTIQDLKVDHFDTLKLPKFPQSTMRNTICELITKACREFENDGNKKPHASVIKAGAGYGKTTVTIQTITDVINSGQVSGRIMYFVPNQDSADEVSQEFKKLGVKTLILKGKERLCHSSRSDLLKVAHEQKLSTKGLCKIEEVRDAKGNIKTPAQTCPFYDSCDYIKARKNISSNVFDEKVVILPVQYLKTHKGIPEEINPSLIVVDESFHTHLMKTFTLKYEMLGRPWVNHERISSKHSKHIPLLDMASKSIIRAASAREDVVTSLVSELGGGSPALTLDKINSIISLRVAERAALAPIAPSISKSNIERLSRSLTISQGLEIDLWRSIALHLETVIDGQSKGRIVTVLEDQNSQTINMNEGWVISVSIRDPFPFAAPILHLDASANEDIYRSFLDETHEVSFLEYEEPHSSIHRTAIINKSFSTASLTADETSNAENVRRVIARKDALRNALNEIGTVETNRKVLVIATKRVAKILENDGLLSGLQETASRVEVLNFGRTRATNKLQDFDTVILIGKPEKPVSVVAAEARCIDHLQVALDIKADVDTDTVRIRERAAKVLYLRDGQHAAVSPTSYYVNDAMFTLQVQEREEELYQAEARLRANLRTTEDLRSYFLTDAFPDVLYDDVLSIAEFEETRKIAVNIADASHNCVSAKGYIFFKFASHEETLTKERIKKHKSAASNFFKRWGFTKSSAPQGWCLYKVKFTDPDLSPRGRPTDIYTIDLGNSEKEKENISRHIKMFSKNASITEAYKIFSS